MEPSISPVRLPPAPVPRTVPPAVELSGVSNLVTLAVSVVVVGALYFARDVLIPVTLAVLLSFLLAPPRRYRLGRPHRRKWSLPHRAPGPP